MERQLEAHITQLVDQNRIHSVMSISAFLNPVDELVEDEDKEILDTVIDFYIEGDREQETDEESVNIVLIKQHEAMQAVQLL